ncbi:S41 family peptidase [Chiayiivirga flava]|uniref:Tricorn protease homolog n=1 Tax=Chiayiivirga flava TaxID=659595 RepID=A0A7W8D661_9GAMM|nr:S41 family peptidase [Chiayiivirga flava]MBB5208648.1 tricorn protease [Chiayiivirga flava]
MKRIALLLGFVALGSGVGAAEPGYFRYPAIHGDTVLFTAEGDLWSVARAGGAARRLTTHAAEESRAAVSPDGRSVAFSASYHGPLEVYVMPLAGGDPRRVSFENTRALTLGWTAQGEVLYATSDVSGPASMRVVAAVDPASGTRRVLPLADANDAVLSPDGNTVYFVRFGLSVTGDNARGYRGGALSQLWRFDLARGREGERIGPQDVNLRRPLWWKDRLIVIADRGGRDNLFLLDPATGAMQALTQHTDFGVRSASLDGDALVYQLGADIHALDLASRADTTLDIDLVSDFDQRRERWIDRPARYVEWTDLAADGERVALTARGRVTVAGIGPRRRVDIGAPLGTRLTSGTVGKDGKFVYAISDASGEEEVWQFPADGSPGGKQLTRDADTQRWNLHLSPDGKTIAHDDKRGRLWLLDIASGRNTLLDDGGKDGNEGYSAIAWAPDSRHLAFARATKAGGRERLALAARDGSRMQWLTSEKYESASPAFSRDGRWLWFLSERQFALANGAPWGDRNTGPFFDERSKVYAIALQADNRFPFRADDELAGDDAGSKDDDADKSDKDAKDSDDTAPPSLPVTWDGLADRLYEVPLPAGDYRELQTDGERLYLLARDGESGTLSTLEIGNKPPKTEEFATNVAYFAVSADGGKVLFGTPAKDEKTPGTLHIVNAAATAPKDLSQVTVRLDDWRLRIDPRAEWTQMFGDAWRMHRDHFFDKHLRGVDWPAVRARYAPLLERVTDRNELDDVLAQAMGELGALHSQIVPGDTRRVEDTVAYAGLGARYDKVARGWRVTHIARTEAELPSERAPLQAPGVDVRVGDTITAINGVPARDAADISELLRNTAGQQVLLQVERAGKARKVVVVPVDARREEDLRYIDWTKSRAARVEQAGGGRLGYLHLRAMGGGDMAAFVREFYAQFDRDGLIIDVRRNRGGNIDSWIIEKLLRRAWAFWSRPDGLPYSNMQQTFRGHLVVLTDALTYSDGETFAAGVQALKIAPLIGTRTAGAGVWLSDGNALVDRGRARVAEYPQYGIDGQWLVENVGVSPDIVVDNLPHATFNGGDAQLDRAIAYLQQKLASDPVPPMRPGVIPPLEPVRLQ